MGIEGSKVLMNKLKFLFDEAKSYERPEDKKALEDVIEEIVAFESESIKSTGA